MDPNTHSIKQFNNLEVAFAPRSDKELKKMHLIFSAMNNSTLVNLGIKLTNFAIKIHFPIKWIMKKTMFGHFCGGETIQECTDSVNQLGEYQVKGILDYSVEGSGTEESFELTKNEVLQTIKIGSGNKNIPFAVFKMTGLGDYELMTKIQEGKSLSKEEETAFQNLKNRVDAICQLAHDTGTRLLIDAEDSWYQDTLDEIVYEAMAKYNKERCVVFNTFQMYRHDMFQRLKRAHQAAKQKGHFFGAKLVRGAYMEKERERAAQLGYPSPIQTDKASTDRDYDAALEYCVKNIDTMNLFSGSHNEKSNLYLAELINNYGLQKDDERIYFSQLYGMSDNISFNLANEGYNVVKYVPYGPVEKVMPYLSRRAEENTSIAGQSSRELELIKKEIQRRKIG